MVRDKMRCRFGLCISLVAGASFVGLSAENVPLGPLFQHFALTLASGERSEIMGPLFYSERKDSVHLWALPPLLSYTLDPETDFAEFDFVYPLLTYDRFGSEYRFQIGQVFNFAGGRTQSETNVQRFTLFPIYFQQRSATPEDNYTALLPVYGHLKNRLFRDEVKFVLMPVYVQSRKRDVVTDNYLYPVFHLRHGDGLKGWQVWPLIGHEEKEVTATTNNWGETQTIGGHNKFFALWPIFFNQITGIGTENLEKQQAMLPLYSRMRSPQRDSLTVPWPLGVTHTVDRTKKFSEWAAPWPLIVFVRGEGKTTRRVWPLFSQAHNGTLQSDWYLWPIYKYNRLRTESLDRERTRIMFFLYSDITEKNTETGEALHRIDFWPFFTSRRDLDGNQRWQILSILEPLLPNNKSIERNYSTLWSLWRSEKNRGTGSTSQSLLWNLYRHESATGSKKYSLLFGAFQYQSNAEGKRMKLFYVPMNHGKANTAKTAGKG